MPQDDYCATRTAAAGGDPWLIALFASAAQRPALQALGALRADLAHLVAHRSEPAILGARAGWWQQELSTLRRAPGQHPATRALAPHAARDPALHQALLEWALHLNDELGGASLLEPERWRRHLLRAGRLHEVMARLCDGPADEAAALGATLAELERLATHGERAAQSRPLGALGASPAAVAPTAEARDFIAARATTLGATLGAHATAVRRHAPLAIAVALGSRRARALGRDPLRAWTPEPPRALGAVAVAWHAAWRAR